MSLTTQAVLQRQHIQQLEADVAALKLAKEDLQSAKEGLEHQVGDPYPPPLHNPCLYSQ
jgi:prefoldin subunit 5